MSLGFVVSVAGWTIFVLQDSVLTGLRLTPLVSVENTLFSAIKVAIVVVLAGLLPVTGIVVSWWVGLAMALIATNAYIFLWVLPRHTAPTRPDSLQLSRRTVTRFAAPDYIGGLCWLGVVSGVPLIVIAQVGAVGHRLFLRRVASRGGAGDDGFQHGNLAGCRDRERSVGSGNALASGDPTHHCPARSGGRRHRDRGAVHLEVLRGLHTVNTAPRCYACSPSRRSPPLSPTPRSAPLAAAARPIRRRRSWVQSRWASSAAVRR